MPKRKNDKTKNTVLIFPNLKSNATIYSNAVLKYQSLPTKNAKCARKVCAQNVRAKCARKICAHTAKRNVRLSKNEKLINSLFTLKFLINKHF